jgi:hypothetical protein
LHLFLDQGGTPELKKPRLLMLKEIYKAVAGVFGTSKN